MLFNYNSKVKIAYSFIIIAFCVLLDTWYVNSESLFFLILYCTFEPHHPRFFFSFPNWLRLCCEENCWCIHMQRFKWSHYEGNISWVPDFLCFSKKMMVNSWWLLSCMSQNELLYKSKWTILFSFYKCYNIWCPGICKFG